MASLLALTLAALITPLFGHHSSAAYDVANVVTLKGIVTALDWRNPHVRIHVNVPDGGRIVNWDVETLSTGQMSLRGVTNGFIKPGDSISLDVFVAKDAGHTALVHILTLPDGRKVDGPPIDIR
jgi:hypothetical protein